MSAFAAVAAPPPMEVHFVRVNSDNYAYLIIDTASKCAAAVDPCEPDKLIAVAAGLGCKITTVLTTHGHWDHAGGNVEIRRKLGSDLVIVGGVLDDIPACTRPVKHGDSIRVGSAVEVSVYDTPCHTPGHVSFLATASSDRTLPGHLFTGDTMFVGGCGNLNSGTPAQMHHALVEIYASLPPTTIVWVGHEYTVKNLKFAHHVEPDNARIAEKLAWAKARTAANEATVPSTIGDELNTNPFVRCTQPSVQAWAGVTNCDSIETLRLVRKAKDRFRYPDD